MNRIKTLVILAAVAMLSVGHAEPSSVENDPAKYSSDWVKLTEQIRTTLPGGWVLEISPFKEGSIAHKRFLGSGHDPMIVIYNPIPIHAIPKQGVSFVVRPEPFLVRYSLEPKVAQKKWEEIQVENVRSERLMKGYESKLAGCAKNSKDSGPSLYDPKTDEEKQILREFYFVSGYARSVSLPDHWFGSLAVFSQTNAGYTFREKDVEDEYSKVVSRVFKLMNSYAASDPKKR